MKRDGDWVPYVSSGSYPIRGGNLVRPLVDGGPAFGRIAEVVASARRSVWVSVAFPCPFTRSIIHSSTRRFCPKPGHRNLPSAPVRNQLTWKMAGGLLTLWPIFSQCPK